MIEDLNQKKCVRSYVTEALSLLSQKFISGVWVCFQSRDWNFRVFPNHLFDFFLHLYIIQVLLAPLCKLKLLLAQGLSQHLSLLGIFSVVWGIEAVLDLLFSLVGWCSNTMGTSVDDGRTLGIVQILLYFDHIWVLVLCAPSSNDVSVLLLNLSTMIMKRTLMTRSSPTGRSNYWNTCHVSFWVVRVPSMFHAVLISSLARETLRQVPKAHSFDWNQNIFQVKQFFQAPLSSSYSNTITVGPSDSRYSKQRQTSGISLYRAIFTPFLNPAKHEAWYTTLIASLKK